MKSKSSLKDKIISSVPNDQKSIPLAESMRPNCLDDIVGQTQSFGTGSMLHSMLVKKKIPNMILWGPPGCGKVKKFFYHISNNTVINRKSFNFNNHISHIYFASFNKS